MVKRFLLGGTLAFILMGSFANANLCAVEFIAKSRLMLYDRNREFKKENKERKQKQSTSATSNSCMPLAKSTENSSKNKEGTSSEESETNP